MASIMPLFPGLRTLGDLRPPPTQLRSVRAWHGYKLEQKPGKVRLDKIPFRLDGRKRTGKSGSAYDLTGLGTFDEAYAAATRHGCDGVAFALLPGCGFSVIDGDKCLVNGKLPPELEELALHTFTEVSVSGTGAHFWYVGDVGDNRFPKTEDLYGLDTFAQRGWIAYTGVPVPDFEMITANDRVSAVSEAAIDLVRRRAGVATRERPQDDDFMAGWEPTLGLSFEQIEAPVRALDPGMSREPWFSVLCAIHHETRGSEEGFDLANDWSADAHNYCGEDVLRSYWDRMHEDGSGRRRVTMASVMKMAREVGWQPDGEADRKPVTAEDLEQAATSPEPYTGKFRPTRASDMSSAPPRWLIKGVLPQSPDPVILYGASGSGKSFLAIQYAGCIARGVPWRGHKAIRGKVLYVAAEGAGGVRKRLDAYCQREGIDIADLDVDVLTVSPNLMDPEDIKEIVRMHSAFGPYLATVLDTFAQVTPGANENAGEDMGLALANTKAIQRATGTTALLVHHAGKDLSRGSRGWSGIKAAAEAQIEVTRDEVTGERAIRIDKMKDGEDGKRYGFALETVTLCMDEDGDNVTSCVLVETDAREQAAPAGRGSGIKSRDVYATRLVNTIDLIGTDQESINVQEFIAMAAEGMPVTEGSRDLRQQNLTRALTSLLSEKDGPLSRHGNTLLIHI